MEFGDYVIYVDEAGDHGPASADFPVFVLAFCIFRKRQYCAEVLRDVHSFKFKYLGHDAVVLHEREIRKSQPPFDFLLEASVRGHFLEDLNALIRSAPFTLIAVVVDKRRHLVGANPYSAALDLGLVNVTKYLRSVDEQRLTHVVVESRGKKEDAALAAAFDQFCSPAGTLDGCNLELQFAAKTLNHSGMQLADMVARPIGRHVMNPSQSNRAYELLRSKFWGGPDGANGLILVGMTQANGPRPG